SIRSIRGIMRSSELLSNIVLTSRSGVASSGPVPPHFILRVAGRPFTDGVNLVQSGGFKDNGLQPNKQGFMSIAVDSTGATPQGSQATHRAISRRSLSRRPKSIGFVR